MRATELQSADTVVMSEAELNAAKDVLLSEPTTYVVETYCNKKKRVRMYSSRTKAEEYASQARKVGIQRSLFKVVTGSQDEKDYLEFVRAEKDAGYVTELGMELE
jgi:hypothetical protein